MIFQGKRTDRIKHCKKDGSRAHQDDRQASQSGKINTPCGSQQSGDDRPCPYLARRQQTGLGHPHRTEPAGCVSPFLKIRHIIDQVGKDLQEDRAPKNHQCGEGIHRANGLGNCNSNKDWCHGSGQGARPNGKHPPLELTGRGWVGRGGHGVFRKRIPV